MYKKLSAILVVLIIISLSCFASSAKEVDTSYIDYVEQQSNLSAVDDYSDRVLIVVYDDDNNIQSYNLIYTKADICYWSGTYVNNRNQGYRYQLNSDFSVNKVFSGNQSNASVNSSRIIIYSDFDILDRDGNVFYSADNNMSYQNEDNYSILNIFSTSLSDLTNDILKYFSIVILSAILIVFVYICISKSYNFIRKLVM